jgi:hypothetical protein
MLAETLNALREMMTVYLAAGIALSAASVWAAVKAARAPRGED